ncbi:MAG: hypothetical protein P4M08_12350 [Oligoflexia bacterium]|nr:hypothetical protein [Oligoflexia bacterium]
MKISLISILAIVSVFSASITIARADNATGMQFRNFKIAYDVADDTFVTTGDTPKASVLPMQELAAFRFEKLKADTSGASWKCLAKGAFITVAGSTVLAVYELSGCTH